MEALRFRLVFAVFFWIAFSFGVSKSKPQNYFEQRRDQLRGRINDLPVIDPYQPQKAPLVPIKLGERRCDNIYHGAILPCLLRPDRPPFSYSTERAYNTEY